MNDVMKVVEGKPRGSIVISYNQKNLVGRLGAKSVAHPVSVWKEVI